MKKKACGNLMELELMILKVPSVAAWTSEFKVRDYLREKLILFANVTRKQKAISKWSKIWLHYLQQQMASQLHKLKESNLLCTISRFLPSIICLKNWSLRILNNSYLFSLQLFKMATSMLKLQLWKLFHLSFHKLMILQLSSSIPQWCQDFLTLSLPSCNKMKPRDKQVLRLWSSSLPHMAIFGKHAFQNLSVSFPKSSSTKISKRPLDHPL